MTIPSKLPVTLAILLGGKSRRMGFPKHSLRHKDSGRTLLQVQLDRLTPSFSETLLLPGPNFLEGLSVKQIRDDQAWSGCGPLVGLLTACRHAKNYWIWLLACDYPEADRNLVEEAFRQIKEGDRALVFKDREGREQWLCGLYHRDLAVEIEGALSQGTRAMKALKDWTGVSILARPEILDSSLFVNLNTPLEARSHGYTRPS